MAFLITVLVGYLAWVLLILIPVFTTAICVKSVDLNDQSRIFSSLLLTIIVVVFFFFFFQLFEYLPQCAEELPFQFPSLKLRFFNPKIFYKSSLITRFIAFCRLFTTNNALVYFSEYRRGQETSFSFGINQFLHQLYLIVQLLAALLYLGFNWGPKTFTKKTY